MPGGETAISVEFASGTGPASAMFVGQEWIRWNEVFTPETADENPRPEITMKHESQN